MVILYWFGIKLYTSLVLIASFFHKKARLLVQGRRKTLNHLRGLDALPSQTPSIWFHFASLGEFEQGRSVLAAARQMRPDHRIVVTFYSPSGFEAQKDSRLADLVLYLPADLPENACLFYDRIQPVMAIFTKYEYWHYYLREGKRRAVPIYMISSIFRKDQIYFKAYGGFFRQILSTITHFFTQNQESATLLASLGFHNTTITGDTRFDRVATLAAEPVHLPKVSGFVQNAPVLVAGSTWQPDEDILAAVSQQFPTWKLIIAPHEIHASRLAAIEKSFTGSTVRYSQLSEANSGANVLIIDNIGMLSSLYAYGDLAYIGGGFGAGIHNSIEAAAHGKPVIFGPRYSKFEEAKDLLRLGAAKSIESKEDLKACWEEWSSVDARTEASKRASDYVNQHKGATDEIVARLFDK